MGVIECWKPEEVGYNYCVSLALATEQSLTNSSLITMQN